MKEPNIFVSAIGPVIARYLALKQALGRRPDTALRYTLIRLDRFLASSHAVDLSAETFASWCSSIEHLCAYSRRQWMRTAYHLCLFRRRTEPSCFVPDPGQFPPPPPRPRPYIFSHTEIALLLRVANARDSAGPSPLYRHVSRLAVVLLYTAGLRRGELVRLTLGDYTGADRTLLIRDSKFHKSRLVPLSEDAATEMERYLRQRRQPGLPCGDDAPLLLNNHGRFRAYTGSGLGGLMRKLFRAAGVRNAFGCPPRTHDLRFTFAAHALLRWYRAGIDVQAKLPALSAYMGHRSIVCTQYYLTLLDATLESANERFREHCSRFLPLTAPVAGGGQ